MGGPQAGWTAATVRAVAHARAYDQLPYDDRPVAETHPDRLWVVARANGLVLPEPSRLRVLELGCANAVNLIPMAFHLPEAQFLGVDIAPSQVSRANARVAELGLQNLTVVCADVMEFEPGEDTYDLIIAHGLFSWIPDAARDRVLALCRRALAPHGIAYISYNAMPAWGIRQAIGRALQEMARGASSDEERLARVRSGLARLAKV